MPHRSFDAPGSLMERTRSLLTSDARSLPQIFVDTGVPFYWLRNFATGKLRNPSVNRVQYLYEQLSGQKLDI